MLYTQKWCNIVNQVYCNKTKKNDKYLKLEEYNKKHKTKNNTFLKRNNAENVPEMNKYREVKQN